MTIASRTYKTTPLRTLGREAFWDKSGIFSGSVKAAAAAVANGSLLSAWMCDAGVEVAAVCATTRTLELVAETRMRSAIACVKLRKECRPTSACRAAACLRGRRLLRAPAVARGFIMKSPCRKNAATNHLSITRPTRTTTVKGEPQAAQRRLESYGVCYRTSPDARELRERAPLATAISICATPLVRSSRRAHSIVRNTLPSHPFPRGTPSRTLRECAAAQRHFTQSRRSADRSARLHVCRPASAPCREGTPCNCLSGIAPCAARGRNVSRVASITCG
jgi:hypothetical protein